MTCMAAHRVETTLEFKIGIPFLKCTPETKELASLCRYKKKKEKKKKKDQIREEGGGCRRKEEGGG